MESVENLPEGTLEYTSKDIELPGLNVLYQGNEELFKEKVEKETPNNSLLNTKLTEEEIKELVPQKMKVLRETVGNNERALYDMYNNSDDQENMDYYKCGNEGIRQGETLYEAMYELYKPKISSLVTDNAMSGVFQSECLLWMNPSNAASLNFTFVDIKILESSGKKFVIENASPGLDVYTVTFINKKGEWLIDEITPNR